MSNKNSTQRIQEMYDRVSGIVDERERPRDVGALRAMLEGKGLEPGPVPPPEPDDLNSGKSGMTGGSGTKPPPNRLGLSMSIVAALLIAGLFWWLWPEPGRLALDIEPSDARVILPDIELRYRRDMALPKGRYRVEVRRAGYEEFTGTVRIEAGERTMRSIVLRCVRVAECAAAVFRDALKDGGEGPEMVALPAGSFRMGSPSDETGRYGDEGPVRRVTISQGIAMGRYEVTFADYDRFVSATGRESPYDKGWGRGRRPVIYVSQEDAQAYAAWLSAQTGKTYRLPSEAEWEYAARAGRTTRYSWGNEIGRNRANCDGCGSEWDNEQTSPVGSFEPNVFGLYDMHGNVWECVADCYHEDYEGAPTDGSAWTTNCDNRSDGTRLAVLRGGSWYSYPRYLRAAYRGWNSPSNRDNYLGFRLVQDLNP